jgi:hypothetical protein
MADATVTRYALSLGAQDVTHGYYAASYASSSIDGSIQPKGAVIRDLPCGNIAVYNHSFFTAATVALGDEIKDANNTYYVIKSLMPYWWLNQFSHYVCELEQRDFVLPPTTSGTWHLDSDSAKTDPRYRHKSWLDIYLTATNLKEDNGSTNATYITCFDEAPYPLSQVFLTKEVDLIFSIGKKAAQALEDYLHYPYAFIETVPITLYAVNKSGLTATNLLEQAEQEIRHIATHYPVVAGASIRSIDASEYKQENLGGAKLWTCTVTIKYKRANDDYVPSTPTISYGSYWTFDCDHTSGGIEGTWTFTQGAGSTATQAANVYGLDLNCTVFGADSSTVNGTNIGVSSTTYTTIRWSYKTTGDSTAKIIITFSDASTQTVLSETASSTYTVDSATITSGKTIDHITLYNCDGVGHVYYRFLQICKGTYIFPNVVDLKGPFHINVADIAVPGRQGNITQIMGSGLEEYELTCDLDIEHSNLTWKRPQTSSSKTDYNNDDIFRQLTHFTPAASYGVWEWLDLGDPTVQMRVNVLERQPDFGEGKLLKLKVREYRPLGAGYESYIERYGLNL